MASTITFANHSPIRIADADQIQDVWDARWDFGHRRLRSYTTKRGNKIYWISQNSGSTYNGHEPETIRTYLRSVAEIRDYFADLDLIRIYHREIEAEIDPNSIVDVDAIA